MPGGRLIESVIIAIFKANYENIVRANYMNLKNC